MHAFKLKQKKIIINFSLLVLSYCIFFSICKYKQVFQFVITVTLAVIFMQILFDMAASFLHFDLEMKTQVLILKCCHKNFLKVLYFVMFECINLKWAA